MFVGLGAALVAALTFVGAISATDSDPGDVMATRAFLRADYALLGAVQANIPTGEAATRSLVASVTRQCPDVLAVPKGVARPRVDNGLGTINLELTGAFIGAIYRPDAKAATTFVNAVERLQWESRTLATAVDAPALAMRLRATLTVPDVCKDMEAWSASGFKMVPIGAQRFSEQVRGLLSGAGGVPLPPVALRPYERPGERTLLDRLSALYSSLAKAEAVDVASWRQLEHAIDKPY